MLKFVSTPVFLENVRVKFVNNRPLLHCVWTMYLQTFGMTLLFPALVMVGNPWRIGLVGKDSPVHTHPSAYCCIHRAGAHSRISKNIHQKERILNLLNCSAAQESSVWHVSEELRAYNTGVASSSPRDPGSREVVTALFQSAAQPAPPVSFSWLLLPNAARSVRNAFCPCFVPSFWAPEFLCLRTYFSQCTLIPFNLPSGLQHTRGS